MVTISTRNSLEAHESLCFIDSLIHSFLGAPRALATPGTAGGTGDTAVSRADVALAIPGLYSCGTNSQRNTSKTSPYKKSSTPRPSGTYPRNARLFAH